jgi:eukaryotic-like serine/threonine-protein kinase
LAVSLLMNSIPREEENGSTRTCRFYNVRVALSVGTRLGPFEIVAPLGAGGMGEVYRARDTRLGREVALKILPERVANDPTALARFEREAQVLASLSHPNIVMLHDIGKHENVVYAIMELLRGQTLRSKLAGKPLAWQKACEYGNAIADGLAAAHAGGVIHRDLKPDNIFVANPDQIKILDFGLARFESSADEPQSWLPTTPGTAPGLALGTVGYMSPEQIRGTDVDLRTDIFSLGCVLYEMISGKAPFFRNTAADTMSAILKEQPLQLIDSVAGIPPEMDQIVLHCLEKNREQRFQSAQDLAFDLKQISTATHRVSSGSAIRPTPQRSRKRILWPAIGFVFLLILAAFGFWFYKISAVDKGERIPIAVADFLNETQEKELNGLSGMFITSLEQSSRLAVMTRSRMFDILKQMGKKEMNTIDEAVGRELCKHAKVPVLVTASVRKFGQLYTIDLKILEPDANEYLFTAIEQGKGQESIPQMLDHLSQKTRIGLKEKESQIHAANKKIGESTTTDLQAYQHYFQGEQFVNRLHMPEAEKEFSKAVELDPAFGLAFYRLAYVRSWSLNEAAIEPMQKAMQYITKVPEKEQLLFHAFESHLQGKDKEAIALYQKVVEKYPTEKEAVWMIGDLSFHTADYKKAEEYLKKVLEMDRQFDRAYQHLNWTYFAIDQPEKALTITRQYVANSPSFDSYNELYFVLRQTGHREEALQLIESMKQLYPDDPRIQSLVMNLYTERGEFEKAEQVARTMIASSDPNVQRRGVSDLQSLYGYLGRMKEMLAVLQQQREMALQQHDSSAVASAYLGEALVHLFIRQDPEKARATMAPAIRMEQYANPDYYRDLFNLYMGLGDVDKTEDLAQRLKANSPFYVPMAAAVRHKSEHQIDRAIQEFQQVSRNSGNFLLRVAGHTEAGALFVEQHKFTEAAAEYKSAVKLFHPLHPFYGIILYRLADAFDRAGDRTSAIKTYRELLNRWTQADPDFPPYVQAKRRLAALENRS